MFYSFLEALRDGEEHKTNEIKTYCADKFNLTYEERNELFQSGGKIFDERVDRTRKYLKNAGLITSPMRMKPIKVSLFIISSLFCYIHIKSRCKVTKKK